MQSNNAFEGSERVSSLRQSLALVGPTLSTICSGHLPWTMVDNPRMMTLDDDGDGRDCKRCTADITVAATVLHRKRIIMACINMPHFGRLRMFLNLKPPTVASSGRPPWPVQLGVGRRLV
uniref:Uncharacterized protein n=1 Tax=Anopheles coluzzii TaxID=1518534 RepID=A0A8W7P302_ANOCL